MSFFEVSHNICRYFGLSILVLIEKRHHVGIYFLIGYESSILLIVCWTELLLDPLIEQVASISHNIFARIGRKIMLIGHT